MKPQRTVSVRRRAAQFGLAMTGCILLLGLVPFLVPGRLAKDPSMSATPVLAAARDAFHIEQPVSLSRMPPMTLERATVTVTDARAGVAVAQLLLDRPVFVLSTAVAADGVGKPYGPDRVSPLIAQLAALGFKQISIRNGTLRIVTSAPPPAAGEKSAAVAAGDKSAAVAAGDKSAAVAAGDRSAAVAAGDRNSGVTLTGIDAQIATDGRGSVIAGGRFIAFGEPVTFDMTAGPAVTTDRTGAVAKAGVERRALRAAADSARFGELRFDGYLQGGDRLEATGNTQVRAKDAAALLRWIGARVGPAAEAPPLEVSGDVSWADGEMAFKTANVTFGPSSAATGALTFRYAGAAAGARPGIAGTLGFSSLDLGDGAEAAARARRLELLAALDVDLRVSANQVTMAGSTFGRAAASVNVREGVVTADVAELEWSGGRVSVQVSSNLAATDRTLQARGRIVSADARDGAVALMGRPLLAGALTTTFDLKGTDCTLPIEARRCEGKLAVAGQAGARGLVDLARLAALADAEPAQRKAGPLPMHAAPAPLDAVDVRMTLRPDGLVVDQGQVRAGEAAFGLGGRIDVASGMLNLIATRQWPAKPPARKPPRDVAPAALAIGGTLAQPTVAPAPQP